MKTKINTFLLLPCVLCFGVANGSFNPNLSVDSNDRADMNKGGTVSMVQNEKSVEPVSLSSHVFKNSLGKEQLDTEGQKELKKSFKDAAFIGVLNGFINRKSELKDICEEISSIVRERQISKVLVLEEFVKFIGTLDPKVKDTVKMGSLSFAVYKKIKQLKSQQ